MLKTLASKPAVKLAVAVVTHVVIPTAVSIVVTTKTIEKLNNS